MSNSRATCLLTVKTLQIIYQIRVLGVNHVAKEVIALHCYLGAKAYHFKKIVEVDVKVTRLSESIQRSIVERDNKS